MQYGGEIGRHGSQVSMKKEKLRKREERFRKKAGLIFCLRRRIIERDKKMAESHLFVSLEMYLRLSVLRTGSIKFLVL